MNRIFGIAILVALGAGCGGGDDDASDAIAKCDDFVVQICLRAVSCAGDVTQAECEQEIQTIFTCSDTLAVSGSYNTCLDQVTNLSCAVLFPGDPNPQLDLPADCSGVILQ